VKITKACEKVYVLVDELGSPKKMTKREYADFLDELICDLRGRLDMVNSELRVRS
jgi:polyhydroxyalkanoate synthesis regulator phasin